MRAEPKSTSLKTPTLNQRAAGARTGPGGAAEAVITSEDLPILHLSKINVPQMQTMVAPATAGPLHLEHLIKVAIKDFSLPTDIDCVAAHQSVHRSWIKGIIQQCHVLSQLIVIL